MFHQVTPVLTGDARTTIVYSFHPRNVLALEACHHLSQTYNKVDPLHIFLSDWARYRAWKAHQRCLLFRSEQQQQWSIEGEHHQALAEAFAGLCAAVDASSAKLLTIADTLPYTDDRAAMETVLSRAIADLKQCLKNAYPEATGDGTTSVDAEMDTKENTHDIFAEFRCSRYGLSNLRSAVAEIDNCVTDILTLKDSGMEYF